jgi:hypothetical protein
MQPHIPEDLDDSWPAIGADTARASREAVQDRFEESAVRRLLASVGLTGVLASLKKQQHEFTGQDNLLFARFYHTNPSFPVRLYFRKIPYMHQVTQVDLFQRFSTTQLFRCYEEVHERDNTGKPVGLVFDWPAPENAAKPRGLGMMIVHNLPLDHDCPHTRFSRRFMTEPPQTVHVMRYGDFLEGLEWRPN